jgi:hypothetical protein
MSVASIGVDLITPRTGTSTQTRPQQQANERERVQPIEPGQAPPRPGTGKLVDKQA